MALCREPTEPAGETRGWARSAPPWGRWCPVDTVQRRPRRQPRRWHDEVVTERAVLQGGYQRGETDVSPLWNEIIWDYVMAAIESEMIAAYSAKPLENRKSPESP